MLDTTSRHAGPSPGGVDSLGSHACEWFTKHCLTPEHDICTIRWLDAPSVLRLCESRAFAMVAIIFQPSEVGEYGGWAVLVPADFLDQMIQKNYDPRHSQSLEDKVS